MPFCTGKIPTKGASTVRFKRSFIKTTVVFVYLFRETLIMLMFVLIIDLFAEKSDLNTAKAAENVPPTPNSPPKG